MGREDPQLKLRLTGELKERITEAARENGRSVNAEIVSRLTEVMTPFEAQEEIVHLKEQVAFYKGINESLTNTVRIFVERLVGLPGGTEAIVEEIHKDELGIRRPNAAKE